MSHLLHDALVEAARTRPDRDAVRSGERSWTFGELDRWSRSMAAHLADVGIGPGDRIAVRMTNRVEVVVAVHAISRAGAAAVLLSPAWKERELGHAIELTGPRLAIIDRSNRQQLSGLVGDIFDVDRMTKLPNPIDDAVVDDEAEAVLVFSSGTTGLPKAVRHTHRSMRAATEHWRAALGLGADDRFQIATPPSHILGLLNLLVAIDAGAMVRLHARFDLDEELRWIQDERMTLEMAVAPIALAMANHPDIERYDLSSLRYVMWCATPVTESVAQTITRRTGVRILTAYGASELPVLSAAPVVDPSQWRLDTPGRAPDGVELRIVDLATGDPVPPGAVGEIEARSASAMTGYLPDDPGAFHDGWYRTGDVGWLEPEGWVHITDRSKEMVKVNGFQVAPAEVEAVLHGHPAVRDCAVFGIPDDRTGEAPIAAVALDPDRPVAPDELTDLVARTLASYKRLRHLVVVDEIPRLPSGKALRRELRTRYLAGDL